MSGVAGVERAEDGDHGVGDLIEGLCVPRFRAGWPRSGPSSWLTLQDLAHGSSDGVSTGPPDQSQRGRHAARHAGPSPAAGASPLARSRWVATRRDEVRHRGRVPVDDRRDVSRRAPTVRRRPPRLKGGLCTGMRHEAPPADGQPTRGVALTLTPPTAAPPIDRVLHAAASRVSRVIAGAPASSARRRTSAGTASGHPAAPASHGVSREARGLHRVRVEELHAGTLRAPQVDRPGKAERLDPMDTPFALSPVGELGTSYECMAPIARLIDRVLQVA